VSARVLPRAWLGPGVAAATLLVLSFLARVATAAPSEEAEVRVGSMLPLISSLPFAGILLSIAVLPQATPRFWNRHYGKVAAFWGLAVAVPFWVRFGALAGQEVGTVLLADYVPFVILLWSLYTVTGGILISGGFNGTPASNALFLALGAILASLAGTTGAAMLLVRPLLRANAWRRRRTHQVVFFIFLVCNVGGSLTPLGDPPLFLGFLHGIPFLWTLRLLPVTGVVTLVLLAAHYGLDAYRMRAEETPAPRASRLQVEGGKNLFLLLGILAAVIGSGATDLGQLGFAGVGRDGAGLLRDAVLIGLGLVSLRLTPVEIRTRNHFTWAPIREVATLFPGIFVAMVPVILILKAGERGGLAFLHRALQSPADYFWVTGGLSSVLDNTPTYLVFLSTALGTFSPHAPEPAALAALLQDHPDYLEAISAGAVFLGAMTYLGNAPNLLVRSVAQESGLDMPGFFAYTLRYAVLVLLPTFALAAWWFF